MDNRELAQALLCEASELLNESTRQDREEYKKGIKNSKYWGTEAAKEESIGRKLANKADSLRDQADKEKWYKLNTKKDLRNKADDTESDSGEHYSNSHSARYNGKVASKKSQNETVAFLLAEATEILNESNARQKHQTLLKEQRLQLADEIAENKKKLLSEPAKRELYGKNAIKSKIDEARMKLSDKSLSKDFDKIGKTAEKYSARATSKSVDLNRYSDEDFNLHSHYVNKKKDRIAKEKFMEDFGGKKLPKKRRELHARINKRGELFKSQHESIAVLLTEAALLLNNED